MAENAAIYLELQHINNRLESFLQKESKEENIFAKLLPQKELNTLWIDVKYTKFKAVALEKAGGDETHAKEMFATYILVERINNNAELRNKEEFQSIVRDMYQKSESWGINLVEIWSEELYKQAKLRYQQYVEEKVVYTNKNTSLDEMKNELINNESIKNALNRNVLVTEKNKDDTYYSSLRKLYPEVDRLIDKDSEIQKLMKINNPTEEDKKNLRQKIQEKAKVAEESLHTDTNRVIQEQAITTCLDTLKAYMDIDLSEQENVLEQFTLKNKDDKKYITSTGNGIILEINGKINNKNLKIYYNLSEGTLQQEEFLAKDEVDKTFSINHPVGGKKDVVGIQLPKFQDFIA